MRREHAPRYPGLSLGYQTELVAGPEPTGCPGADVSRASGHLVIRC
jgi:hypothetical protein